MPMLKPFAYHALLVPKGITETFEPLGIKKEEACV